MIFLTMGRGKVDKYCEKKTIFTDGDKWEENENEGKTWISFPLLLVHLQLMILLSLGWGQVNKFC